MSDPRRQGGFTLVELMAVCALTAILAGAMAAFGGHAHDAERRSASYSRDLLGCRAALATLETDLRTARAVESGEGLLILGRADSSEVTWAWGNGVLARSAADGERHFAECIEDLVVENDGQLFRIAVRLGRGGRTSGPRRSAKISTVVFARVLEAP